MFDIENERMQLIANKIIVKLMKMAKHKKHICIYPLLNEENNDNDKMYFHFYTNAIDCIGEKNVVFFDREMIKEKNTLLKKYDLIILYEGIENHKKNDIRLSIINTNTLKITFYVKDKFEYNENYCVYFNKEIFNKKYIINENAQKIEKTIKNKFKDLI